VSNNDYDGYGTVDMQSLARRVGRAILHFMSVSCPLSILPLHTLIHCCRKTASSFIRTALSSTVWRRSSLEYGFPSSLPIKRNPKLFPMLIVMISAYCSVHTLSTSCVIRILASTPQKSSVSWLGSMQKSYRTFSPSPCTTTMYNRSYCTS
jgi:hypothetical protein